MNDRCDPSSNNKLAVALFLPCVTVTIAVLSKHTLFFVVCDGGEVMDNEAVSVVIEFTGHINGGLPFSSVMWIVVVV